MSNPSTKDKGDQFENEIASLLRFLPDSVVTQHVKISGKDVDILLEYTDPFSEKRRIAIDCKNYAKPMTRDAVSKEWNSYYSLIAKQKVDSFWLVTRNDIVANAKEVFSDKSSKHFTSLDIQNLVLGPQRLIDDMERQFSHDNLDKYYVPARGKSIDIRFYSKYFDVIHSNFVKFASLRNSSQFEETKALWLKNNPGDRSLIDNLNGEDFSRIAKARQNQSVVELESLIDEWVANPNVQESIAILGSYGTGKSSFARKIAWSYARKFKSQDTVRMPLLIELKEFSSHQDLRSLITDYLVNRHRIKNYSYELFRALNREGQFLVIFDGFDEMKLGMTLDALIFNFNEINQLQEGFAKVIVCGRPTVFSSDDEQCAILAGSSRPTLGGTGRYIQLEVAPLEESEIFKLLYGFVAATNVPRKGAVKAKLKQLEHAVNQNSQLRELLSRPVHLPMLVTVLPTLDGNAESLSRPILYEHFIQHIITREMARLLPALREKYSRQERFTFASSLALAMLNSGELMTIRYSEIPTDVVTPFVRAGETVDIAKRDLVTNCFLERKPPDLFTFGHKSFGEFLAACGLLDLVRAEASLDAEVKRSSIEVWDFFNELVTENDLDAILGRPDRHAMCITLALGAEGLKIFNEYCESILRFFPSIRGDVSLVGFCGSSILERAFPGGNTRENWQEDSVINGAEFQRRVNLLLRLLYTRDWRVGAERGGTRPQIEGLRRMYDLTTEIRSWYSR